VGDGISIFARVTRDGNSLGAASDAKRRGKGHTWWNKNLVPFSFFYTYLIRQAGLHSSSLTYVNDECLSI
jgi:hypothetical protein